MKLKDCLDAFESGKGIKRKIKKDFFYIKNLNSNKSNCYLFDLEDFNSDDWQIEPDKKDEIKESLIKLYGKIKESLQVQAFNISRNCVHYTIHEKINAYDKELAHLLSMIGLLELK